MSVVAFAGDWHGNTPWATERVRELTDRRITKLLHVGDFGIWPGPPGKRYLLKVETACAEAGVDIWITPGNHEDWGRLTGLWEHPKRRDAEGRLLPLRLTDHIAVLPRGHRWIWEGRSFVSLGGAPSIDIVSGHRRQGLDWWPEEMIQPRDVEDTIAQGYADIMVTHDAPAAPYETTTVARIRAGNPLAWKRSELVYAALGSSRMSQALLGVAPRLLVHGHLHADDEAVFTLPGRSYETRVWSLGCDGQAGNIRYLDLATLSQAR